MSEMQEFFAASISGTSPALCEELRELGFSSVRLNRSGIPFRGTWQDGWRACLQSRIATRIHALLSRFPTTTPEDLYTGVQSIDWSPFISYRTTLSVSAVCVASEITHSGFAALKTKDAIVDQIRSTTGKRPSIDKEDPDVRVFVYIANNKATVYLDLSGDALHRRGYRKQTGEAPLKETLASALLRLSDWDRKSPLIDPMCGSGTIAIEAALWASNTAPGLGRERFGFERWANFGDDEAMLMRDLRGKLRGLKTANTPRIRASDIDESVLELAKKNARSAGVKISFKQKSIFDLQGTDQHTVLVTNPPYGVRLATDETICRDITSALSRLHGWRVSLLAGSPEYERTMSLKPKFRVHIPNGDIKCDFLVYDVK